jgi:hypothetical protein
MERGNTATAMRIDSSDCRQCTNALLDLSLRHRRWHFIVDHARRRRRHRRG